MAERGSLARILVWGTFCLFVTSFSYTAFGLFMPELLREFGATAAEGSLPFAVSMLVWGILQPVAGALADSRGTRPVILGGIALAGIGFLVVTTAPSLWLVVIGYGLLVGSATSASGTILFALLISKWFSGAHRGSAVGVLHIAPSASPMILTPIVFLLMTAFGWRYGPLFLALLLILAGLPAAYLGIHDPPQSAHGASGPVQHGSWREALRTMRHGPLRNLLIARFACGLSFLIIPHLAMAALAAGLTSAEAAAAITLFGASGAVGSYLGGAAADRFGRVPTVMVTYALRGLGALALGLITPGNPWLFYLAVIMTGGPSWATVTINNVQGFELTRGRNAGLIMGFAFVLHQLAAAAGPFLSGVVFDVTGTYRVAFVALGVVLLLAIIPSAYTGPERAAVEPKEQVAL